MTENADTFDKLDSNYLIGKAKTYTLKNKTTDCVFKGVTFEFISTQFFFYPPPPTDGSYVLQGGGVNKDVCIGRLNVDDWLIKYEGDNEN